MEFSFCRGFLLGAYAKEKINCDRTPNNNANNHKHKERYTRDFTWFENLPM